MAGAIIAKTAPTTTPLASPPSWEEIPPLESGDRLARPEFERRFNAMPNVRRAELIEGIVYMASPVAHNNHGGPHSHVIGWLSLYRYATPYVQSGADSSVRIDLDNIAQPDGLLFIPRALGGRVRIDEDDYVEGTPELVVEVASSSVSYDLHTKLGVYRRLGTPEYIVWRTRDRTIDWFLLVDGRFERQSIGEDGLYRSVVFPGLWLDPKALIRDDGPRMLEVNRLGTSTPDHTAFVERLALAATPKPTAEG